MTLLNVPDLCCSCRILRGPKIGGPASCSVESCLANWAINLSCTLPPSPRLRFGFAPAFAAAFLSIPLARTFVGKYPRLRILLTASFSLRASISFFIATPCESSASYLKIGILNTSLGTQNGKRKDSDYCQPFSSDKTSQSLFVLIYYLSVVVSFTTSSIVVIQSYIAARPLSRSNLIPAFWPAARNTFVDA